MLQHPVIHPPTAARPRGSSCCTPGVRAAGGRSSPCTGPRVSWWHQSLCDAVASLPRSGAAGMQPLPELCFLSSSSLCLEGAVLAAPELPQPGKPKGAKMGEKKGLNRSSNSFWLFSGFYGPVLPRLPSASLQMLSVPVPGGSGMKQNHFHTEEWDRESWGTPLGCPVSFTLWHPRVHGPGHVLV